MLQCLDVVTGEGRERLLGPCLQLVQSIQAFRAERNAVARQEDFDLAAGQIEAMLEPPISVRDIS